MYESESTKRLRKEIAELPEEKDEPLEIVYTDGEKETLPSLRFILEEQLRLSISQMKWLIVYLSGKICYEARF